MSNLTPCVHVAMLEAVIAARICHAVIVDDGSGPVVVEARDMESSINTQGETIVLGPVSFIDRDVALSCFNDQSGLITLMMNDARLVTIQMIQQDSDAVIA